MEKFIYGIVKNYIKVMDYLMTETKWGFKRAAIPIVIPFLVGFIMSKFNMDIAVKFVLFSMAMFGLLYILMYLDSSTKFVRFISKGKYENTRQLLKNMTHLSYVYGVIISVDLECIIIFLFYLIETLLEQEIHIPSIEVLFCIIFLVFSFFYFVFHLYVNPQKLEILYIKQRLQLYTVWGTTASFLLLIINENGSIKIFVTGILLDYLWVNYFITDKENKLKKKIIQ